jgi:hypothetical protein
MKKIIIEVIPHSQQRYPTVGDYWKDEDGTQHVVVSDMGNDDYAFLVAIHELVELYLCDKRGIKEEDISAFDIAFEKEREEGKHTDEEEPGYAPGAPYKNEHFFAEAVERLVAGQLDVDWKTYDKTVNEL